MGKDEPPEELQKSANDEETEREWNWVKTRGEYEFDKIWEKVKKKFGL